MTTPARTTYTAAEADLLRRIRQAQRDEWWGCVAQPEPIEVKPGRTLTFFYRYGAHVLGVLVLAAAVLLSGW